MSTAEKSPEIIELVKQFESIGDNCEFGLMQRQAGAEPLGLLRFAWTGMAELQAALRERFSGIEDIELSVDPSGEIVLTVRPYNFRTHTWMAAAESGPDLRRPQFIRRNKFLRDQMIGLLESGERIFVRKQYVRPARHDIDTLHTLLRQYGPNTLLWVTQATDRHPAGSVDVLADGLLCGYIDRLAPYGAARNLSFDCWIEICRAALSLRGASPRPSQADMAQAALWRADFTQRLQAAPPREFFRLARPTTASMLDACGRLQFVEPDTPRFEHDSEGRLLGLLTEPLATNLIGGADGFDRGFAATGECAVEFTSGLPALRQQAQVSAHRLRHRFTGPVFHRYVPDGLVGGAACCASFWIWVPSGFTGTVATASVNGFPRLGGRDADLALRDCWQRVWCSAEVPDGLSCADPCLFISGDTGDMVYTTCWQLEAGEVPSSYIPTSGEPAMRSPDHVICFGMPDVRVETLADGALVWEGSLPAVPRNPAAIVRFTFSPRPGSTVADVVVSSALGLQLLVNGQEHALLHPSAPANGERFRIIVSFGASGVRFGSHPQVMTDPLLPQARTGRLASLALNTSCATHHRRISYIPAQSPSARQ